MRDNLSFTDKRADNLGLKRGTVKVVPYNPNWQAEFATEKQNLLRAIGDYVSGLEHIGSTSVPGLAAKPIIDMIAAVDNLSVYKQLIDSLAKLGYEFMPERVFKDRIFFPKGLRENRTHHLNLVIKGSKGWIEPILFRDYLINNQAAQTKYQNRKIQLAKQYPDDRVAYTKAKEQVISEILKKIERDWPLQVIE